MQRLDPVISLTTTTHIFATLNCMCTVVTYFMVFGIIFSGKTKKRLRCLKADPERSQPL
jgi:hypothetical protein